MFQYGNALANFLDHYGSIKILEIGVSLHLSEPSTLYKGRDFALGRTIWEDAAGERHFFSERWVRQGAAWYTRSTGLLVPDLAEVRPPQARSGRGA